MLQTEKDQIFSLLQPDPRTPELLNQSMAWPQGPNSPLGESFISHVFINQPHRVKSCCLSGTMMITGSLVIQPWIRHVAYQEKKSRRERICHTEFTQTAIVLF